MEVTTVYSLHHDFYLIFYQFSNLSKNCFQFIYNFKKYLKKNKKIKMFSLQHQFWLRPRPRWYQEYTIKMMLRWHSESCLLSWLWDRGKVITWLNDNNKHYKIPNCLLFVQFSLYQLYKDDTKTFWNSQNFLDMFMYSCWNCYHARTSCLLLRPPKAWQDF
jgi:hypothetical protein